MIRYQRRVNPYPVSAPIGLPPRAPATKTSIERFGGVLVTDPVVFLLGSVYGSFIDLYSIARNAASSMSDPHVYELKNSIAKLREFYTICSLEHIRPDPGLERLLTHIHSFAVTHTEMQVVFESNTKALGIPEDQIRYLLDEAQTSFNELLIAQKAVNREQLALQSHLEHFIAIGTPERELSSVELAEEFYAPLFELRDEYFEAPKRGMLEAYLELTANLEEAAEYQMFKDARNERIAASITTGSPITLYDGLTELEYSARLLEDDLVTLEVMVLMESAGSVLSKGSSR